ncbi:neuronal-glial cell adhesion molecule-like, partial [Passer montanus]|uniref:neuronal-glial cell adhesion molecule-like n=1 Tax=Passer montanus TaxID=9160 RepID=UPI001960FFF4
IVHIAQDARVSMGQDGFLGQLWGIVHIAQDARVSMGQDGFLYFANAQVGDSHPDYICHAHYLGPRTIIQKEPLDLRPHALGVVAPAERVWVSRGPTPWVSWRRLNGPTPWVSWRRLNAPLPPGRAVLDNFNHTLRLRAVSEADDGEYECTATNGWGELPDSGRRTLRDGALILSPGMVFGVLGMVFGVPNVPNVPNVPTELPDSGRRTLRDGALILSRLEPNDSAVAQCEASNSHGRLLANAFVYVVELPVQILTPNSSLYAVVENQTAFLHCRAFGAPAPTVEWLSPGLEPALQDDRAFAFTNGSLRLGPAARGDSGVFTCRAHNGHSNASVTARLDVRGQRPPGPPEPGPGPPGSP